jgi:hypothetical protein
MSSESEPMSGPEQPSFDMFSARIGAAVRMLIYRLDIYTGLLNHVDQRQNSIRKSPNEIEAARQLSAEQRRDIEKTVDEAFDRFPDQLFEVLESLVPRQELENVQIEDGTHHPIPEEQAIAVVNELASLGAFKEIEQKFDRYRGDMASILYAQGRIMQKSQLSPSTVLGESILPGLIASLEHFLAALVRTALSVYPLGLGQLPSLPSSVMQQLSTKRDMERYVIDVQVHTFISGSPEEWSKGIKRWTKIDVATLGADWPSIREAIERRHVFVHNGGRIDEDYRQKSGLGKKAGPLGQRLFCTPDYMSDLLEDVRVFALVLAIRWANHFGDLKPLEVYPDVTNEIHSLERAGHWEAAFMIADTSIGLHGQDEELDDHLRVNWWLCRKHLGKSDARMIGEIYGWVPTSADMRAARFALLEDDAQLAKEIRQIVGEIKKAFDRRDFSNQAIWKEPRERSAEVRAAFAGKPAKRSTNAKDGARRRRR